MKNINRKLLWLFVAVLAIIPIGYFLIHWADSVFRDNAMGNWFATMIGALVGILIALEINRIQQELVEKRDNQAREKEEAGHRSKILRLIKKELEYNYESMSQRQPQKEAGAHRAVFVNRLKDELWNAFSDGGELQWIRDLDLLDFISDAYYHIRIIIFLEEKYFEATHFSGMMIKQDKYPKDRILEYLSVTDPIVLKQIERALKEIDQGLVIEDNKI